MAKRPKQENLYLKCLQKGCKIITGIDNDIAFAHPVIKNQKELNHSVAIKNVLYFFPQMNHPIDPTLRMRLLETSPESFVLDWLKALYQKNQEYLTLKQKGILTKEELTKLKLPIRLLPQLPQTLCQKLHVIKALLTTQSKITHNQIFVQLEPIVYKYYREVQKKHPDPIDAIHALYKFDALTVEETLKLTTQITSRSQLETAIAKRNAKRGDFEKKRQQPIEEAIETFLSNLDFQKIPEKDQVKLLLKLAEEFPFLTALTIKNSTSLSKDILTYFTKKKRLNSLQTLILTGCSSIKTDDLFPLSHSHPNLALTLGKNQWITDRDMITLSKRFKNLHILVEPEQVRLPLNTLPPNLLLYQIITHIPNSPLLLQFALKKGASIHTLYKQPGVFYGKNSLHIAAQCGLIKPLKFLIEQQGGDPKKKDYKGKTPLDRAIQYNHKESHKKVITYLKTLV